MSRGRQQRKRRQKQLLFDSYALRKVCAYLTQHVPGPNKIEYALDLSATSQCAMCKQAITRQSEPARTAWVAAEYVIEVPLP